MSTCPSLETLFEALENGTPSDALEHVAGCEDCAAIVEEHRQLEKDLFRLADPLPPVNLVSQVMSRVSAERMSHRVELKAGLSILVGTVALATASFVLSHGQLAALGTSFAARLVSFQGVLHALSTGATTLWETSAAPTAGILSAMLAVVLLGLRRLSLMPAGEMRTS